MSLIKLAQYTRVDITKDQSRSTAVRESTYSDLRLDIELSSSDQSQHHSVSEISDISLDTDEAAIRNSFANLFTTSPGEKILNPEYGSDLRDYLFERANDSYATIIQDNIASQIAQYETRVILDDVRVKASPDEQEYLIDIEVTLPKSNKQITFRGSIDNLGFTIK